MTGDYTPTRVVTDEGEMHFQEYFVRRRCEPRVREIHFDNIESAVPAPGAVSAILEADAVIICPSNPFISIGPILAVPGLRDVLRTTPAPVIAITPIIEGRALKGPAADMLRDLGYESSARAVAAMYQDFCDVFVLDARDTALQPQIEALGLRAVVTDTVMTTLADKQRLASDALKLKTDLAQLRAALAADVLHWKQVLRADRVTLRHPQATNRRACRYAPTQASRVGRHPAD